MSNSLLLKNNSTRAISQYDVARMMSIEPLHSANLIIEFRTDAEGIKLANKFKKLCQNPSIKLNVKFKKI